jgi:hypothetical protein
VEGLIEFQKGKGRERRQMEVEIDSETCEGWKEVEKLKRFRGEEFG